MRNLRPAIALAVLVLALAACEAITTEPAAPSASVQQTPPLGTASADTTNRSGLPTIGGG